MTCKVLLSPLCYAVAFESIIANPASIQGQPPIKPCLECPSCLKLNIFPRINRCGASEVIFDLFIQTTMTYTVDNVINHIRKIENIGHKLFLRNVKKINPVEIKKMLFVFISARIIDIDFDINLEKGGDVVLCLAKVKGSQLNLALLDDRYWESIDTTM